MKALRAAAPVLLLASCASRAPVAAVKVPGSLRGNVDRQIVNAIDAGDGDYQLHVLRARIDASPADLSARLELAARYRKLGFPEIAIEHGRLACERAPDSEAAHLALAKMLRDAGRPGEGAALLSAYSAAHDAGAPVWAWLGLLRDDAGDWKAGEDAHRKAVALAPDRDDLHNNLGYCLLRQGRAGEAEAEFRLALRLNSHSVIATNNLGTVPGVAPVEAVTRLQSVNDPASAHNNLAVAYLEAGKYPEARREIDLALRYNRQHSAALNNLRLVSELDGKPAEVPAPVRNEGRWARVVSTWRRLRGHGAPADSRIGNDPGSSVASR